MTSAWQPACYLTERLAAKRQWQMVQSDDWVGLCELGWGHIALLMLELTMCTCAVDFGTSAATKLHYS